MQDSLNLVVPTIKYSISMHGVLVYTVHHARQSTHVQSTKNVHGHAIALAGRMYERIPQYYYVPQYCNYSNVCMQNAVTINHIPRWQYLSDANDSPFAGIDTL